MTKVYAPNREYNGVSAGVQFVNGEAETDNPAALAYFTRSGYGIDAPHPAYGKPKPAPFVPEAPAIVRGPESLDAAVQPNADGPVSDAFLPPTNAGKADPHGPAVVSPGLHGVGPAPIRPGEVYVDDPQRQQDEETELAQRVLVDGEPATIAGSIGPDGNVSGAEDRAARRATVTADAKPPRTKAEWVEHAVSAGVDRDEADDMTIAQIKARVGAQED